MRFKMLVVVPSCVSVKALRPNRVSSVILSLLAKSPLTLNFSPVKVLAMVKPPVTAEDHVISKIAPCVVSESVTIFEPG